MKMKDAMKIIEGKAGNGFMVSFEKKRGTMLYSDHVPDMHAGEPLIPTEADAWYMAYQFAKKTVGECVNIYVIDHNFKPVSDYKNLEIENRE